MHIHIKKPCYLSSHNLRHDSSQLHIMCFNREQCVVKKENFQQIINILQAMKLEEYNIPEWHNLFSAPQVETKESHGTHK